MIRTQPWWHGARAGALATLAILAAVPAARAQLDPLAILPAYDDRSTPQTLVFSLYNAINKHDFSRAFAYFSTPPAASLDAYAAGFDDMAMTLLVTGPVAEEGAAGSVYATVPVVIRSVSRSGAEAVFAGCVQTRRTDPAIMDEDARGLRIAATTIRRSDKPFDAAMPGCDPSGKPIADEGVMQPAAIPSNVLVQAIAMQQAFAARHSGVCNADYGVTPGDVAILPRPATDAASGGSQPVDPDTLLLGYPCDRGAYNLIGLWLTATYPNSVTTQSFARPELDIRYGDPLPTGEDGPMQSIAVSGWMTSDTLINSGWDEATSRLSDYSKWRGIGDAYSSGTWRWGGEAFVLDSYDVDADYDGEQKPVTVYDSADRKSVTPAR